MIEIFPIAVYNTYISIQLLHLNKNILFTYIYSNSFRLNMIEIELFLTIPCAKI